MRQLMAARDPVYALADLTVESREAPHERVVQEIVRVLDAWLADEETRSAPRQAETAETAEAAPLAAPAPPRAEATAGRPPPSLDP